MRYLFIIFILLSFLQSGFSQYQPIQNQYILNPFYINPSFAGAVNGTLISATQRSQWIEFPEAPNTQTIAYQTNKGKVGLGGWVYRDQNGLTGNTGFESSFAYHLSFKGKREEAKNSRILFGLAISGNQWTVREDRFTPSAGDPLVTGANPSRFTPNAHVGFYFSHYPFYAGISVRDILPAEKNFVTKSWYNIHFLTGFQIPVANDFYIEPSFLLRLTALGDWQTDVNATIHIPISNKVSLLNTLSLNREQLNFKNENLSASAIFGLKIDAYQISYRYIYPLSLINSFTIGGHEWMLSYRFGKTKGSGVFCPTFSGY
jgi:type IX secretion system PorP/SprF family membrane protein